MVVCSLCVFLSMCLFLLCVLCLTVLVNCLLNAFAICVVFGKFLVSSILNKILDWIILLKEHKSLSSSPFQDLSTTQCTHSLLEIVDYYNYINLMYLF